MIRHRPHSISSLPFIDVPLWYLSSLSSLPPAKSRSQGRRLGVAEPNAPGSLVLNSNSCTMRGCRCDSVCAIMGDIIKPFYATYFQRQTLGNARGDDLPNMSPKRPVGSCKLVVWLNCGTGRGAGRGLVVMRRCDDRLPHVGLLEAAPGCSRPRSRSQSRSRGGGSSTSGRASPYPPEAHAQWWGAKPVCSQNGVGPRCSGSATSTPVGRPSISCCTWLE